MLSEIFFLNETKNHNHPCKLNGRSLMHVLSDCHVFNMIDSVILGLRFSIDSVGDLPVPL